MYSPSALRGKRMCKTNGRRRSSDSVPLSIGSLITEPPGYFNGNGVSNEQSFRSARGSVVFKLLEDQPIQLEKIILDHDIIVISNDVPVVYEKIKNKLLKKNCPAPDDTRQNNLHITIRSLSRKVGANNTTIICILNIDVLISSIGQIV